MQQSKRSQRSLQLILLLGKFQYAQLVLIKLGTSVLRFVEAVLNSVIEKNDKSRVASGGLIAAMLSRGLLGEVRNLVLVVVTCSHAQHFAGPVPHSPGHPARVR